VQPSIVPAKLARLLEPFDDPAWLFELKHDGFRSLAYIEDGKCRLVSRHRNVYKSFETLRDALADLKAKSAILDGEIVCLDANGCSQFKELLYRRGRAVFFAFDLVWLDGADLRQMGLIERKKQLKKLIQRSKCSEILYAQRIERDGKLLFEEVVERNLEGMVAKRRMGAYAEHGWLIKNAKYTQAEGRHEMFEALQRPRKSAPSTFHDPFRLRRCKIII
jgi:bifunctional non-homologous end joining protein LigD